MGYSADQQAIVQASIATLRSNAGKLGGDLFIYFFKKFPAYQNKFPHYKGKAVDSLRSVATFGSHTANVFTGVLDLVGKAGDAGVLAGAAKQVIADHVSRGGVNAQEYGDLFVSMIGFMGETLGGGFDAKTKGAWEAATGVTLDALKAAM